MTVGEIEAVLKIKDELSGKMADIEKKVTQGFKGIGGEANRSSMSVGGLVSTIGKYAAGMLSVGAAVTATTKFVTGSIKAYAEQEAAVKKMTVALEAQGMATPNTIRQYKEMASAFQRTTVYGDELINEMQALLVQVGDVMPRDMERALKASTDLAAGLGIDLKTATLLVGKAFAGETGTLSRYGIVIDEAKLKTEGAAAVLDALQAKFGGQASGEIETYTGKMKQLTNAIGDLMEVFGEALTSGAGGPIDWLTGKFQSATTDIGSLGFLGATGKFMSGSGGILGALGTRVWEAAQAKATTEAVMEAVSRVVEETLPGAPFPRQQTPQEAESAKKAAEEKAKVEKEAAKESQRAWKEFWDDVERRSQETAESLASDAAAWVNYLRTYVYPAARGIGDLMTPSMAMLSIPAASGKGIGTATLPWFGDLSGFGSQVNISEGSWLSSGFGSFLSQAPQTILGAIMGGGSVTKSVGSMFGSSMMSSLMSGGIGKSITGALTGTLGKTLGGAIGSMIPGIGALLGPALSWVGGLFGPGKEYKQVKSDRASFEQSFGGVDKMIEAVSKAYADLGRSGAEAERALKNLWNARTPQDYERAVKAITSAIEQAKDRAAKLAQIDALKEQIADLEGKLIPSWQEMAQLAEDYGIELDALGQNFQQLKMDDTAQGLLSAYEKLIAGGVDANVVLAGMTDEINAIVQSSIKLGTKIPENMRPLIEALIASGQLFDENGQKIEDISQLSFGEEVKTDAQLLRDTIAELTDAINKLVASLDDVPGSLPDPFAGWNPPGPYDPGGGGGGGDDGVPQMASGGIVRRPTLAMIGEAGPEAVVPLSSGLGWTVPISIPLSIGGAMVGEALATLMIDPLRRRVAVTGVG